MSIDKTQFPVALNVGPALSQITNAVQVYVLRSIERGTMSLTCHYSSLDKHRSLDPWVDSWSLPRFVGFLVHSVSYTVFETIEYGVLLARE